MAARCDHFHLLNSGGDTALEFDPHSERAHYCRSTDLPKLIAIWPHELSDTSTPGQALLISKLKRALRQERLRGLSGHWTYDLARHSQLLQAYKAETAALPSFDREKTKGPAIQQALSHR